jgi:acyl carrier protein
MNQPLREIAENGDIGESANEAGAATAQELELAQLIVATLNLETAAADVDPAAPLYGEGLGLDSIDILELALAIAKTYGVQLRSEDENNRKIFASLRRLNSHIQQHRTK